MSKPIVLKIFRNGGVVDVKQFVDEQQIVIGSSMTDVHVKIQGQVSPFHASIEKRGDKYVLADLGSSQGTYLKGSKVLEAVLEHGDKVAIGEYILEFYVGAPTVGAVATGHRVPAPSPDDEPTLVNHPAPGKQAPHVVSKVQPMQQPVSQQQRSMGVVGAAGTSAGLGVVTTGKRKKGEKTFAPASTYKNLGEFVKPTKGSTVEVLVAWKERVISSYHFHNKGMIHYGSHPSCDVVVPSLTTRVNKAPLVQIDGKATVFVPPGMAGSLSHDNQTTSLSQLYSSGRLQAASGGGSKLTLAQGEMVRISIGGDVELVIRYCSETPKPVFIPMVDFASNGFLAVLLAVILAIVVSLYVALNKAESKPEEDEEYRTALIIENPPPPPPPVKIEKQDPPPEVEKKIEKIPEPPKPVKVEAKKEPVPQKMEVKTEPKREPVKQAPKAPAVSAAKGGDGKAAQSMKPNPTKPKSNQVGSVHQGASVKVSKVEGSQMQSKDPKNSGIFGVFGSGGKQNRMDQNSSGAGELAGLANKATGTAGSNEDRAGEGLGSKFKETGGGNGKGNVGVQGISNGTGKGLGSGGFNGVGLGGKGTVSIVPGGGGEEYGGDIDRNGIRQVFINNQRALASCYERALSVNKGLGGKLVLDFDIGEQGRVLAAKMSHDKSTVTDEGLANCVISKMKTWRFPEPPKNQTVQVFYPLAFSNN